MPPQDISILRSCETIYEELDGWNEDLSTIKEYGKLPLNTRKYIKRVCELLDVKAEIISVGADRDQTIFLD